MVWEKNSRFNPTTTFHLTCPILLRARLERLILFLPATFANQHGCSGTSFQAYFMSFEAVEAGFVVRNVPCWHHPRPPLLLLFFFKLGKHLPMVLAGPSRFGGYVVRSAEFSLTVVHSTFCRERGSNPRAPLGESTTPQAFYHLSYRCFGGFGICSLENIE